jgi:hypothetical protein
MNFKESLKSVTKDIQKYRIENRGGICLDKGCVLYCDKPVSEVLELHITKGLTKAVLMEAQKKLLQVLQDDSNIKVISMVSPFLIGHESFMQKFGFEVDESLNTEERTEVRTEIAAGFPENMRGKPFIQMRVPREKFLEINDKPISGSSDRK